MSTFEEDLEKALTVADDALKNGQGAILRQLLALSMDDIKKTVPKASSTDYSKLVTIVEHASAANISQAALKGHIQKLGSTAVNIAKMVAPLATLFA